MIYLKPSGIQKIHDYVIETQGGESGLLNRSMLDVASERPRTFVYGHEPYDTLIAKASVLGYEIIVGHPFVDGNKRTGHAAMETFLLLNGHEINAPSEEQEKVILQVARENWDARNLPPGFAVMS